jgi:hypothetical protein
MKLDFTKLYDLTAKGSNVAFTAHLHEKYDGIDGDQLEEYFTGAERPSTPLEFVQYSGRFLADVIPTHSLLGPLVSDKFIDVLQHKKCTGWDCYPVTILSKKNELIRNYYGIQVLGRAGPIRDELSEYRYCEYMKSTEGGGMPLVGLFFDPETWNETDIFKPENSVSIFITHNVKEALENAKIKGLCLETLSEAPRFFRFDTSEFTSSRKPNLPA